MGSRGTKEVPALKLNTSTSSSRHPAARAVCPAADVRANEPCTRRGQLVSDEPPGLFQPPNVFTERRLGAWPAAGRRAQAASASVPCRNTRNTAGPAPACPPRPADDGRLSAGRSPGWLPQPGQNTSSHGVPAISAARIVGDHSMARGDAEQVQRRLAAWKPTVGGKARSERFPDPAVVHCKRIEGGQLDETESCVRNLLVRFATLQRSSIRKRVKRIASCAVAAERLSQRATNSVDLLSNMQRYKPADASGWNLTLDAHV